MRALLLAALALLTACGDLPQPFRGNPGLQARRLAAPPAYRIAVPAPDAALLPDAASTDFAVALAEALDAADVPAVAGPPAPLDWRLSVTAEREGQSVVPSYVIRDAENRPMGQARGRPVPLQAWAAPEGGMLREVASRDAPAVVALLGRGEATRAAAQTVPFDGSGGPPRVRFAGVRGAPGDGNASLAARMREFLPGRGLVVQDGADGAAFGLSGEVTTASSPNGQQRVEIVWIVTRRDGADLGRAVQLNEVPPGTLRGLWGDVAYVVAQEASAAVRDIIANAGGLGEEAARRRESRPREPTPPAGTAPEPPRAGQGP